MKCPLCQKNGKNVELGMDLESRLRCPVCFCVAPIPLLSDEEKSMLVAAASFHGILKMPLGQVIRQAGGNPRRLAVMLRAIYRQWTKNPGVDPDMIIDETIRQIIDFSHENARRALEQISEELEKSYETDLKSLFAKAMDVLDKIENMMITVKNVKERAEEE